jgi:hypothetical protein
LRDTKRNNPVGTRLALPRRIYFATSTRFGEETFEGEPFSGRWLVASELNNQAPPAGALRLRGDGRERAMHAGG